MSRKIRSNFWLRSFCRSRDHVASRHHIVQLDDQLVQAESLAGNASPSTGLLRLLRFQFHAAVVELMNDIPCGTCFPFLSAGRVMSATIGRSAGSTAIRSLCARAPNRGAARAPRRPLPPGRPRTSAEQLDLSAAHDMSPLRKRMSSEAPTAAIHPPVAIVSCRGERADRPILVGPWWHRRRSPLIIVIRSDSPDCPARSATRAFAIHRRQPQTASSESGAFNRNRPFKRRHSPGRMIAHLDAALSNVGTAAARLRATAAARADRIDPAHLVDWPRGPRDSLSSSKATARAGRCGNIRLADHRLNPPC